MTALNDSLVVKINERYNIVCIKMITSYGLVKPNKRNYNVV